MNFSNHFLFSGLESYQSSLGPYNNFNLANYQQFSYPHYFWIDENYLLSTPPQIMPYGLQPSTTPSMMLIDPQSRHRDQKPCEIEFSRIEAHKNQLPLQQLSIKYIQNFQNQPIKTQGSFFVCNDQQQNQKLSQTTIEKPQNDDNKQKYYTNNLEEFQDKKQIQNLRYQRKNIEANIVNKIYTYLKNCLRFGESPTLNLFQNKEKALIYSKVLEKLEKAKKQNIKREFLKGLISMQSSLPGYNKIAKELLKKGQSIRQFEYNIRVIIRNYLQMDAISSILTSKKMNPQLWKDHILKIREIQDYLFQTQQKQNEP